jgi:hypothetical protein
MKSLFPRCLRTFVTIGAMLACGGCACYPMGLNKEQWEALPPAQQAEYRARQTEIDERRRAQEASDGAREEEIRREREAVEQARIASAYRHARYGQIITVSVQDGMVAFDGKRFPFEPVAFNLVAGETKEVEFVRQGKSPSRTRITMRLSKDGNTFIFDEPSRARFVAVGDNWDRGKEYHPPEIRGKDGHSEAIGITVRIKFRDVPGRDRHGK